MSEPDPESRTDPRGALCAPCLGFLAMAIPFEDGTPAASAAYTSNLANSICWQNGYKGKIAKNKKNPDEFVTRTFFRESSCSGRWSYLGTMVRATRKPMILFPGVGSFAQRCAERKPV